MHSRSENCGEDGSLILLKVIDFPEAECAEIPFEQEIKNQTDIAVHPNDYQNDVLETNFTRYVCGYLIKKCIIMISMLATTIRCCLLQSP